MIALSNIAQGSSVLAMSVLQKKNERAQQVNIPACISCYLGVTEHALFGVNLKYGFPLVCGMIGSSLAAVISIGTGVEAYSIGVGGLPGILSIKPQFWIYFLLAMAVAIVVPFVLTFLVGKKRLDAAARGENSAEEVPESVEVPKAAAEIKSPLTGKVIPLQEIPDPVFSQAVLGDGVEVLIHVGMDTVAMGGDGFQLHVKEGDHVRLGDKLVTFEPEKIRAAGHHTTTAFVVTDPGSSKLKFHTGMDAEAGKTTVMTEE